MDFFYVFYYRTFIFVGFYFMLEPKIIILSFFAVWIRYLLEKFTLAKMYSNPPYMSGRFFRYSIQLLLISFMVSYSIGSIVIYS